MPSRSSPQISAPRQKLFHCGFASEFMAIADYIPRRVVSLQPSATVILAAIGKLDRLVACTRYCAEVCPEAAGDGHSILADSWTANASQIIAARPDLVIAAVPYQEKSVAEIMKAGSRFLGLAPTYTRFILGGVVFLAAAFWLWPRKSARNAKGVK